MWADDATVERYVEKQSDGVNACRERGRHLFPVTNRTNLRFSGVDSRGRLVRRLLCTSCELVYRLEKWESYRHGNKIRYRKFSKTLDYDVTGPNGEQYRGDPGQGRMKPSQVQEALFAMAVSDLTPAQVKRMALEGDG